MNYIESGIRTRLNEEYRELQKRADDLVASEDDLQRDLGPLTGGIKKDWLKVWS